jgi:hypothetical protein
MNTFGYTTLVYGEQQIGLKFGLPAIQQIIAARQNRPYSMALPTLLWVYHMLFMPGIATTRSGRASLKKSSLKSSTTL